MKTYKTFGIAAAAWAALACVVAPSAAFADAPVGDIWYIGRASGGAHAIDETLSMSDNPVLKGEDIRFRFRLLNRNYMEKKLGHITDPINWNLNWYGTGTPGDVNEMKVGVWISGQRRWATVVENKINPVNPYFSELVCSYTAQAGDFGILTLATGPEDDRYAAPASADATNPSSYSLLNRNSDLNNKLWDIVDNYTTNSCNFRFAVEQDDGSLDARLEWPYPDDIPGGRPWQRDVDMSQAGIYVKTVDFDDYTFNTNGIWREVAPDHGTCKIDGGRGVRDPGFSVPGGVAGGKAVTLYAWIEDPTIAEMDTEDTRTYRFADGVERRVATVKINPEADEKILQNSIYAPLSATNKETRIFLCATPTNIFRSLDAGYEVMITNFVTRTIRVGAPDKPSLKLLVQSKADHTATAESPVEIVPISVAFSGISAYPTSLTVNVSARLASGSAESAYTFIGLSNHRAESADSIPASDLNGTSATIEIDESGIPEGVVYAYVKRANIDETTATEKGILIEASVNLAATNYFSGGIVPATLHIKPAPVVITSPAEGSSVPHVPGGTEHPFKIKVRDAYGETVSGSKFTVYWSNSGNGIYTKFPDLELVNGELTVPVKYMTGGTFNSQFYVANQDAPADATASVDGDNFVSAVRTISVQVDEPKVITVTADRAERRYEEGETARLTLTLSEPFSAESVGYLFLVPQDEDSSNLVDCAQFETGVPIQAGSTTPDTTPEIRFLDGKPSTLQYTAVLRNNRNFAAGDEIGGFASKLLVLSVSNVVPRVTSVTMAGTPHAVNNGLIQAKLPKGVLTEFRVASLFEPSEIDLTNENFTVQWEFFNKDGARLWTTNTLGDPYASTGSAWYAFPTEGTNSVTVKVRDKDMTNTQFANAEAFKFYIETMGTPAIAMKAVKGAQTYWTADEDSINEDGEFYLDLNMAASEPLTVEITVKRIVEDGSMAPVLSTYYVDFPQGETHQSFFITEMDGTPLTMMGRGGFTFTAAVTNETFAPNSGNKMWKEYYTPATYKVYVKNKDPVLDGMNDNTVTNYATLNVPYDISWGVQDVLQDMTNDNLKIEWDVPGEGRFTSYLTNWTTTAYSGTYTVTFTKQGNPVRTVRLTVTDKDGGRATRDFIFWIDPQKQLKLIPLGPVDSGQTKLSQKYARQQGRGWGRVWADGALSDILAFWQEWSYEPAYKKAVIFGYGYRAGEEDDGALSPMVAQAGVKPGIDGIGNKADAAPWYKADAEYDSFFYCWVGAGDEGEDNQGGVVEGAHVGPLKPAVGKQASVNSGRQEVTLGETEDEENPTYPPVTFEAIFSREYLVTDNLGDINLDGIPDKYAVDFDWEQGALFEAAEGSLEDFGDVKNLRNWNDDTVTTTIGATASGDTGDFLPSMTSAGSGSLIPNVQSEWALYGRPFHAYFEIRGYGEGLNYRSKASATQGPNSAGDWVSDRDFTDVELAACSNAWVAAGSPGNFEDFDWTPENRTDPTIDDTDRDGLPDGYEYYFWYHAFVGDPETGKKLEGEHFNIEDIAVGTKMKWDKVAELFNPNVPSSTPINERDSDGDGLTDLEEFAMGTNPIHWDTDGDGISDYWEVMRGLNPLVVESDTTTPNTNPDKDYMAWAEIGKNYAVVTLPDGSMFAVPNNGSVLPTVEDGDNLFILAEATNNVAEIAIPVYRYGDAKSTLVPKNRGAWSSETKMGLKGNELKEFQIFTCTTKPLDLSPIDWGEGIEVTAQGGGDGDEPAAGDDPPAADTPATEVLSNVTIKKNQTLTLVHEQVRAQYGFDPRTAWHMDVNGYCVERWDPNLNPVHARRAGESGLAVNTKPYSNKDEYLLLKYRYFTRGGSSQSDGLDRDLAKDKADYAKKTTAVGGIFSAGTTNPNIRYTDKTYGLSETTYGDKKHGADTDSDGVPDGWELYVGFNPNNTKDGIVEVDGDTLALAREYAGTDSCGVYSNAVSIIEGTESGSEEEVATIYKNHPGNSTGWFNKFFPSDPWSGDTDGDNIDDATEGSSWKNACVLNHAMRVSTGDGNSYTFTFIYGAPEDDKSLCIRGGGMNPCSVDTDFDLLPDPWEMCFAGVRAEGGEPIGANFGESVTTLLKRNDGLAATNTTAEGVYITGGMDATFGIREDNATFTGDAYTNPSFKDPRTGTIRNFDFDQDGLQNFQEYLTQTLRHLRYDDSETPLMGSWMPDGSPASRKFLGFLPMNIMDGETFYDAAKEAGFVGSGAWQFRELGYFARPPHEWDPTAQIPRAGSNYDQTGYRVLLPPHGLAGNGKRLDSFGYASTDPRMWDSDLDNMGDYYEIFHGLNPLLGSIANTQPEGMPDASCDVISQIYGGPMMAAFWKNAWTGWPMLPQDWLSDAAAYRDIDAIKYPWMIGTAEADADGDGIRNLEEALVVNMTSPQPTHTDPTPLWMTDSTALNKASYTSQYYMRDPELDLYLWGWTVNTTQTGDGAATEFLFSFEENEGYDTDHDWISDGEEQLQTSTPTSDPLKFSDPDLRQALWFPGANSAAISYSANYHRLNYASYDLLRQFTVEAWIKPEVLDRDQVILERVAVYGASTLSNNLAQVRANFRLGIRADGRLYGLFDTSDAVTSGEGDGTAYVLGLPLANEWTHVALSYDGQKLTLYMNGIAVNFRTTTQAPANGLINFVEDAVPNMANFPVLNNGYKALPCAIVLGAQALDVNGVTLSDKSTWASYGAFYAGYLDEVRVWDGVRTPAEIREERLKPYTFKAVSDLRETIYSAWVTGATRNDNDNYPNLPAELVAHYNFQTLPGAADSKYVAWEPSGFTKNVRDVGKVEGNIVPGDIYCGWWYETPVRNTVYRNWRIVPWIPNTVGHLPLMDGSVVDSQYWSESYAGMTVPSELNVHYNLAAGLWESLEKIVFPNTANPYPYYIFTTDRRYHEFKLGQMVDANILSSGVKDRYAFELRTAIVGSSDLVPLGGAFAKRSDEMWDENGPADAWALTGRDTDANGIPDWWEKVAASNYGLTEPITWDSLVTWPDASGREMTAREAYLRDLARGMMQTGTTTGAVDGSYTSKADTDNDGLPDWWEDLYGIRSQNGLDDADNDHLPNYAEFLISECFSNYGFRRVSPLSSMSFMYELGQRVPDYFLRMGSLYFGEMFTDHDFVEDEWEDQYEPNFASRFKFDAWSDLDDDGWSNFAECRSDYWRGLTYADIVDTWVASGDDYNLKCYPMPTLTVRPVYWGLQPVTGKRIVVRAKRKNFPGWDAVFVAEGASDTANVSGTEESKIIGITRNGPRYLHGHLHPGHILPDGVVKFEWRKFNAEVFYSWVCTECGEKGETTYEVYTAHVQKHGKAKDESQKGVKLNNTYSTPPTEFAHAKSGPDGRTGIIEEKAYETPIGTIDFFTGEYELDLAKAKAVGYDLSDSFIRLAWTYRIGMEWPQALYFSKPSVGRLTEGLHTIEAFVDIDGNNEWTPGEPYGVTPDVDIGWAGTTVGIELTDTAPQTARIDLREAVGQDGSGEQSMATDRGVLGNGAAPNVEVAGGIEGLAPKEMSVRVRIAVQAVNGRESNQTSPTAVRTYPNGVFFDQRMKLANDADLGDEDEAKPFQNKYGFLSEMDILEAGSYDLGWGALATQASLVGVSSLASVTSVTFRVVLGDGDINSAHTNNNLSVAFVNQYDSAQPTCTFVAPVGGVEFTQPTFTWRYNSPIGKLYPAFRLRIYTANTGGTLIYDSGARPAPPRNFDGSYSWTAPIYPDMMTPEGKIFSTTNNYFWNVSMLDAKFTSSPISPRQEFRLEASGQLGKISDYGMIRAKVRYFGPGTVGTGSLNNLIHVQAFTSPDFTGMPAGEGYVTRTGDIASVGDIEPNALILGVKPGTYYIRAFIDSDGDSAWSKWESWGYGNYVGMDDNSMLRLTYGTQEIEAPGFPFAPRPYTVVLGEGNPVAEIYIEDMDTDADHLPDVYEYDTQGSITKRSAPKGPTFFTRVNPDLKTSLAAYKLVNASSYGQTYAPITLLNTILSGSDPYATADAIDLISGGTVSEKVAVRIDAFSLDEGLSLVISSDVPQVDASESGVFMVSDSANVKVILVAADSPDFANARETMVKTITLKANEPKNEIVTPAELRAAIDDAGFGDAAFFKVRLEAAQ